MPLIEPVAQYLRMSTEHQKYSLENQRRVIDAFAVAHGMQVVATYEDAGVSGLGITDRNGLKALLRDVVAKGVMFRAVLVLDVSRWGRFQDPDEAAHYEFICKASGVAVQYCEEGFDNDGSLASSLIKHLKRGMAAEYSRELSEKVHRSQETAALGGWWRGSRAPYGFRRQMQTLSGVEGLVMEHGQRKALHGYRTKLIRGPDHEVETVNRFFEQYAIANLSLTEIARQLNEAGIEGPGGSPWHPSALGTMIENDVYVGAIVMNRSRSHLGKSTRCARGEWRRVADACPALVSQGLFDQAQRRRAHRKRVVRLDDEALLDELRMLLARHGRLSSSLIEAAQDVHSCSAFTVRFGGLPNAYARVGYAMTEKQRDASIRFTAQAAERMPKCSLSDDALIEGAKRILAREGTLTARHIEADAELPTYHTYMRRFGSLEIVYRICGHTPNKRQRTIFAGRAARDERAERERSLLKSAQ